MNIELLIAKSLFESGKVTVPSLGTFILHNHSARLVKTEQVTFIPPQKIVAFSHESEEGTAFTLYVAEKNNCTETEAQNIIDAYVLQCNTLLQSNGSFAIDGVGVIHNDWSFESKVSPEANPEFFGLTDFSIDKLSEAEKKNDREKPLRITKNTLKVLFIASPILFGALLIPNVLQVSQNVELASLFRKTTAFVDSSQPELPRPYGFEVSAEMEQDQFQPQEQEQEEIVQEVVVEDAEPTVIADEPVEEKPQEKIVQTETTKYYVIVGTFSVKSNAEKYSKKLQSKQYDSGVISDADKNRVYLTAFSDKTEADQYLAELHDGSEYTKAWLYVKNS